MSPVSVCASADSFFRFKNACKEACQEVGVGKRFGVKPRWINCISGARWPDNTITLIR